MSDSSTTVAEGNSAVDSGEEQLQLQPTGFLLELSPDWLILRASENVHRFLGEYHVRMIGEPLAKYTMAQPLHDLRNLLTRQLSAAGIARAYRMRLVDDPRFFDFAFQMVDGRILLEGVPAEDNGYGVWMGSLSRMIERLDAPDGQQLLDDATRRLRALSGFDRVVASFGEGSDRLQSESHRGSFAPPGSLSEDGGLPPIVADSGAQPVPVFPRTSEGAAGRALLRAPTEAQREELKQRSVASALTVPILSGGDAKGWLRCESRAPRAPNFELHAAAELFAQIFAIRFD